MTVSPWFRARAPSLEFPVFFLNIKLFQNALSVPRSLAPNLNEPTQTRTAIRLRKNQHARCREEKKCSVVKAFAGQGSHDSDKTCRPRDETPRLGCPKECKKQDERTKAAGGRCCGRLDSRADVQGT
jgi:hypothetical protein